MAVRYQSIHSSFCRRASGAVMIYALVFATAAAVTLYVAASVYQARQKAATLRAYSDQMMLMRWNAGLISRAAYQNSVDEGLGFMDADAFAAANISAANQTTKNPLLVASSLPVGSLWQQSGNFALQYDSMTGTNASNAAGTNSFTVGDLFTLPGWKPRRSGEAGNASYVTVSDTNEIAQSFLFLPYTSSGNFPDDIVSRSDLPFDRSFPRLWDSSFDCKVWGSVRWVRSGLSYNLQASDAGINTVLGGPQTQEASTYFVEEPITNYQLILLDPNASNTTNGWSLTAGMGGQLFVGNSQNTSGGVTTINRAKIFVRGDIAYNFGQVNTGIQPIANNVNGTFIKPMAALVQGQRLGVSVPWGVYDWRLAKPSTDITLGRGITNNGAPNYKTNLGALLSSIYVDTAATGNGTFDRQMEVFNAQNTRMPFANNAAPNTNEENYVNSALWAMFAGLNPGQSRFTQSSVSWSLQGLTTAPWATTGAMDKVDVLSQLSYNSSVAYATLSSAIPADWSSYTGVAKVPLKYGFLPPSTVLPTAGVRITYYKNGVDDTTAVVEVDLKVFGVASATVDGTATTAKWATPRELCVSMVGTPPGTRVVLVIQGDNTTSGANNPPVKIVADRVQDIRLVADPTSSNGYDNYRRFILVAIPPNVAGPANVSLEVPAAGINGSSRWYGVIIAPYGLQFGVYQNNPSYGSTSYNPGTPMGTLVGNNQLEWYGTVLARQSIGVATGNRIYLYPDNGANGFVGSGNAGSPYSVYSLFTPTYNTNLPLERPVPLVVPRMVWRFE